MAEISQNCLAFSEYMNFILQCNAINYLSVIPYLRVYLNKEPFISAIISNRRVCRFYPTSRAKLIAVIKSETHKKDLVKLRRAALGEKPRASIKILV